MNRICRVFICTCLAIVLGSAVADSVLASNQGETLLVTVTGVKAGKGNIRVGVFDDAHREGFPEGEFLYSAEAPAADEQVTVEIANVAQGEYAIAVIQDLNGNKKLDRNFLKIPKESYGFSGAWKSGAASFEEALIDTEREGFVVTIKLK
jgi:uncharacterized protein (DUF2141 family)